MSDNGAMSELDEFLLGEEPTVDSNDNPFGATKTRPVQIKRTLKERVGMGDDKPKPTPKVAKPRVPAAKKGEFIEPLTALYTMGGISLGMVDQKCGVAIVESASACATAWQTLAEQNEAVRKALRSLTQASAVGSLAVAHLPILIAVASHHAPGLVQRAKPDESEPVK